MAVNYTSARFSAEDDNGRPLIGGRLFTYQNGTTTPAITYRDKAGTILNTNPVILDARGEAVVYLIPDQLYTFVLQNRFGSVVWTQDAISGATSSVDFGEFKEDLASVGGSALIGFQQLGTGSVLQTMLEKARRRVDLADFYKPDEHGDDWSIAAAAAFESVRAAGGVIEFPNGGEIAMYLDISGVNGPVLFNMNGCTVRPFAANQGESTIIYASNKGVPGAGLSTNCEFFNGIFNGRLKGQTDADGYGAVNTCMTVLYAWTRCESVQFFYGRTAGVYSLYGQYNHFHKCVFGACVDNNGSYGLLLDSRGDIEAANENVVSYCRFNTNKNHLGILGGVGNRVLGNQFQNMLAGGLGAVVLNADSTGFGNFLTTLYMNYFEFNARDIYIGVAQGVVIDSNAFLDVSIQADTTYNVRMINNSSYSRNRAATFTHPAGSADIAAISAKDNDFDVSVNGVIHAAPTQMDISSAPRRTIRQHNMLRTTGQSGAGSSPLFFAYEPGFKSGVMRSTTVPFVRITQESFAAPALRYSSFELVVKSVNDEAASSAFGYCTRLDKFLCFVTNNNNTTQVFIERLDGGKDVGLSPGFAAIGPITITGAIVGDEITLSLSWAGAGSNPAVLTSITAAWEINYSGANPVSFRTL